MAMEKNGWIKLHRKMLDNPIIMKDADHLAVWMYLLLNATHAEYPALFKGKKIMLQPGQLITGCISIGNQLSITESKVRRTLNDFISDGQIDRQTSNKNSLITVLNWDLYQNLDGQSDTQVTDKRQTSDGQVTTNKNVKNIKNDKNVINNINIPSPGPKKKVKAEEPEKKAYGEFSNVLLTDEELQKLKDRFLDWQERIEKLSAGIASKGYKYKSHYATILSWDRKDNKNNQQKPVRKEPVPKWMPQNQKQYDFEDLENELLANGPVMVADDPALMAEVEALKKELKEKY